MIWRPSAGSEQAGSALRLWSSLGGLIERQEFAQSILAGDVWWPCVGGCDRGVEGSMRIGEPLRTSVVEAGEGTSLELCRRGLVKRNRTLGVVGYRLFDPLDPLGRVEPTVA